MGAGGDGGSSQSVTVSLVAASLGSYSQDLLITHTEGQTQTVSVTASIEALPAVTSTQVLTVSGRVSGLPQGQIEVQILAGADDNLLHSQQAIVEAGSYRLTLMDLSTSAPAEAKFSSQNKIRIAYQQGSVQQSVSPRLLTAAEIASGLVVQDFEIILVPQIEEKGK